MSVRCTAPRGGPVPSGSWPPSEGWMPDPSWPVPPSGWTFWTVVDRAAKPTAYAAYAVGAGAGPGAPGYGTDRGTRIASPHARATSTVPAKAAASTEDRPTADSSWELDSLL